MRSKAFRAGRRRDGSALVMALVMIVVILGFGAAFITVASSEMGSVGGRDRFDKAGLIAESGANVALAELNKQLDLPSANPLILNGVNADRGIGSVAFGTGTESVRVSLLDESGSPTTFTAGGPYADVLRLSVEARSGLAGGVVTGQSTVRRFEACLLENIPFPTGADSAFSVVGNGTGEIHVENIAQPVIGQGNDAANPPAPGIPGLGIQGTYQLQYSPGQWVGQSSGQPVTGAQPITPTIDFNAMQTATQSMIDYYQGLASGQATLPSHFQGGNYNYGTSPSSVTVMNPSQTHMEHGTHITGQGVLIVSGEFHIENGSSLSWNGPVVLLGGNNNAQLHVENSSSLTASGGFFALSGSGKNVEVHVENATMNVTGPMIMSGAAADSKVQFHNENTGNSVVNGFFGMFASQLQMHTENTHNFTLNGQGLFATPAGGQTEIHLENNTNIHVNYNSVLRANALGMIRSFLPPPVPPTYAMSAWHELALK